MVFELNVGKRVSEAMGGMARMYGWLGLALYFREAVQISA